MRRLLLLVFCLLIGQAGFSQSIGIGTNSPDPSAQLDVFSNNKGFLPPRVALQSLSISNPIVSPATGLLIYNTATSGNSPNDVYPGYYYWNGSMWSKISQDNSHQLPGISVKNYNETLAQNALRKFKVPAGKVWEINYLSGGAIWTLGKVFLPSTMGTDLNKYDLLLNQNDSFSITGTFFLSISESSAAVNTLRTFDDSMLANATNTYTVPPNKTWKLNFLVGGLSVSIGNPSVQISMPNLTSDVISAAAIYLVPNTEIWFKNYDTETVRYFFSVSEFDQ